MKQSELISIIRKLIRDEVKAAVTEEVNKSMTRLLAEVINHGGSSPRKGSNELNEIIAKKTIPHKTYTSNEKLNAAMNRAASEMESPSRGAKGTNPPRVGLSEMFQKIDADMEDIHPSLKPSLMDEESPVLDASTRIGMLKNVVSKEPVGQNASVLGSQESNAVLGSVLKKDFRQLMRKIDENKKGGGGGFFAGAIPMTPQVGNYD